MIMIANVIARYFVFMAIISMLSLDHIDLVLKI